MITKLRKIDGEFSEVLREGSVFSNPVDLADEIFRLEDQKPKGKGSEYKTWKKKMNNLIDNFNATSGKKMFKNV
jgi:hypothetical protein